MDSNANSLDQQVVDTEEKQHDDIEVKSPSVFSKVKAKAKKIKNTIKKHGQNVFDYGHDHNNEDHHITDDDQDLDKYEAQQLHQIHENEGVRSAAPTSENLEKTEVNFEDTTVEKEETNEKPRAVDVFPTTATEEHITDQGKTFVGEEKSTGLEEDPPKYNQTELTDLTGTGTAEIDIEPVEKSIERVNVQDEQENATETKSPSAETGSLNQFVPDLYTEQVENLKNSGANSGGTTVLAEEANQEPQIVDVNPTTAINQNITTDQAKTFAYEENSEEYSHGSGSRDEAYTPPEAASSEEIAITEVEKSFERLDVQDELKLSPEPKVFPNVTETQYPPTATESHYQLVSEISTPTETENPSAETHEYIPELSRAANIQYPSDESHDQFEPETISTGTNRDLDISEATEQTFNKNRSGDASNKSGSTAEYGKNIDQSLNEKLGPDYGEVSETGTGIGAETEYGKNIVPETIFTGTNRDHEISETTEQSFNNNKSGDASNKSGSTAEYGKNIDQSLNEKLGLDHGEVAGTGTGTGTATETETGAETEYEVKEESIVQSPGKGVVDKFKDAFGSWFGKTEENQSTQGDEDLTKKEKSGVEVEQIKKAEG